MTTKYCPKQEQKRSNRGTKGSVVSSVAMFLASVLLDCECSVYTSLQREERKSGKQQSDMRMSVL